MRRPSGSKRTAHGRCLKGHRGFVFSGRFLFIALSLVAVERGFAAGNAPVLKQNPVPSPAPAAPAAAQTPASAPPTGFVSISQEVKDVFERSRHAVVKIHGQDEHS